MDNAATTSARSLSPIVCGIAVTMGLRFVVLYTDALLAPVAQTPADFALVQVALYSGTAGGYLLCALLALLSLSPSFLAATGYCAALLGFACAAAATFAPASAGMPAMCLAVGLLAFAVSSVDVFWLHGLVGRDPASGMLTVACGFGVGACLALVASVLGPPVSLGCSMALWAASGFLAFRTAPRLSPALHNRRAAAGRDRGETEGTRVSPTADAVRIAAFLCSISIVTGVASRLFGSGYFGVDLRQETTLFAIVLAALLIAVLLTFRRGAPSVAALFSVCSGVSLASLVAIPFIPQQVDLLVSFLIYAAFFTALITARALLADHSGRYGTPLMLSAGTTLAACVLLQVGGHLASLLVPEATAQRSGLTVFALCAVPLMLAAVPFAVRRQQEPRRGLGPSRAGAQASGTPEKTDAVPQPELDRQERLRSLARTSGCTERECDVFVLVIQGRTRDGIASSLGISPHTVKGHVQSIYRKLGVANKQGLIDLVERALREGPDPADTVL